MKKLHLDKQELFKSIIEILGFVALYAVMDNVSGILKYIILVSVGCCLLLAGKKNKWNLSVLVLSSLPVCVYILLGTISTLIDVNIQITTIKVVLYWIIPFVFSFSLYICFTKKMEHIVNMQFIGSMLAYALFDAPYFAKIFHWESIYAFTFGIFAIYYAHQKKWKQFIVAVLFVFFAEKRIAILAILAALFLLGVLWLFLQNKKLVVTFWGIVIGIVYIYIFLIYSGTMEAFCWGANINTNGRVEIYRRMAEEAWFSLSYLGKGLGAVEHLLECWNISAFVNLHNDLLKFYIELGFCGLGIFLLGYGIMFVFSEKWFGKSQMCYLFGIVVYTFVLFATDNVSIYSIYLIPLYSTIFAVLDSKTNHGVRNEFDRKNN